MIQSHNNRRTPLKNSIPATTILHQTRRTQPSVVIQSSQPRLTKHIYIYCYETWEQLWSEFQTAHPVIADKICNPAAATECPTLLCTHAPWEMVKGTCASCLCVNCEGMNACRRGEKSSLKSINRLKNNIVDITQALCLPCNSTASDIMMSNGNDDSSANDILSDSDMDDDSSGEAAEGPDNNIVKDANTAFKLLRLHAVIDAKTKYDACVACLTCLNSGNLNYANVACVNGDFPTCGFNKIWSLGLPRGILIR